MYAQTAVEVKIAFFQSSMLYQMQYGYPLGSLTRKLLLIILRFRSFYRAMKATLNPENEAQRLFISHVGACDFGTFSTTIIAFAR